MGFVQLAILYAATINLPGILYVAIRVCASSTLHSEISRWAWLEQLHRGIRERGIQPRHRIHSPLDVFRTDKWYSKGEVIPSMSQEEIEAMVFRT